MSVDSTTETRPRVVVLALSYRPQQRVQNYVSELVAAGVDVDLVLAEAKSTEDLELDPRVRISTVLNAELRDVPPHALAALRPGRAGVRGEPDASGRDPDPHAL